MPDALLRRAGHDRAGGRGEGAEGEGQYTNVYWGVAGQRPPKDTGVQYLGCFVKTPNPGKLWDCAAGVMHTS